MVSYLIIMVFLQYYTSVEPEHKVTGKHQIEVLVGAAKIRLTVTTRMVISFKPYQNIKKTPTSKSKDV